MKIALLSVFFPYRGGIAQFSALLYRALENRNEVKAYNFKRQYPNLLFPGSSQFVVPEDNPDEIDTIRLLDTINPVTYRKTAKKINVFGPDVFISQYWMTFFSPAISGVQKRLNKDIKRISILHNVVPHEKRFFDSYANRIFLKYNDGFVVMSDTVLRDLLSLKPDAKYLRIDHPVYSQFGSKQKRADALEKLNLNENKKYLLFFGFIRAYKGLDLLLEALQELPEEYHLIIAGEVYGSFQKYNNLINDLGVSDRVHLYNYYISDDEVGTFFSSADVCVLPYKGATQSGIIAIADHFNLPCIATDVGGLKQNIRHGETGLIVKTPESKLIAKAIEEYFGDELYTRFSMAIKMQKEDNSWGKFADRLLEFSKTL
jgi:glycosyltransferase involved in cell wall biosynthesis